MTKSELTELLREQHSQLAPLDARLAVKTIIELMAQALASANRIEIRGFGTFNLSYKPAHQARNPRTGEIVQVPMKWVPHFKPGKELRQRVHFPGACPATTERNC
jgi:integration host factor subunit beta